MSLIALVIGKSLWRCYEYYKENHVDYKVNKSSLEIEGKVSEKTVLKNREIYGILNMLKIPLNRDLSFWKNKRGIIYGKHWYL